IAADQMPISGPTAPEMQPLSSFPMVLSLPAAQPVGPSGARVRRRWLRKAQVAALALLLLATSSVALALNRSSLFGGSGASQPSPNGTASAGGLPPVQGIGSPTTPTATPSSGSHNNGSPTSGPTNTPTPNPPPNPPSPTPTSTKPPSTPTPP